MLKTKLYGWLTLGAGLGALASFLQTLEKINLLKGAGAPLKCDLNAVFSCTNVLNSWQSSVFGFPNSLMCLVFFTFLITLGLVGLLGSDVPKKLRMAAQAFSLFFLGFGLWYMYQSIFVIGAVCLYCIFCMSGLLVANWALLRLNAPDLPLSNKSRKRVQGWIAGNKDTAFWALIGFALLVAIVFKAL
ncbi:hypothetical protein HY346_01385 [Candidatus Microgenomates bacterium]|nr:hypothetical protein [Candidatus Microgenomates bacterium]